MYIFYEITLWPYDLETECIIRNCLFKAIKVTKNVDVDNYWDSSYRIGLDEPASFTQSNGRGFVKNVFFYVDNNSSVNISQKKEKL